MVVDVDVVVVGVVVVGVVGVLVVGVVIPVLGAELTVNLANPLSLLTHPLAKHALKSIPLGAACLYNSTVLLPLSHPITLMSPTEVP